MNEEQKEGGIEGRKKGMDDMISYTRNLLYDANAYSSLDEP